MAASGTFVETHSSVKDFIAGRSKMLIDGKFVAAASGKTFESYNPATGDVLAHVPEGDKEDIDRAVTAAHRAFEGRWRRMTPSERGQLIWKLGELIDQHADEFAQIESLDNGKPLAVARVADVPLAADLFRYMAGWATRSKETRFRSVAISRRGIPCIYPARTDWRRGSDHPLEFSVPDGRLETWPRADHRNCRWFSNARSKRRSPHCAWRISP